MPGVNVEGLLQRIEKERPMPVVVLMGADPYLRDRCRNALMEKFVPEGARAWAVLKISAKGDGVHELLQHAQMTPMLSPHQILILQDAKLLESGDEDTQEAATEALTEYLENPAPFSIVVLEAEEDFDGRKKLFKVLAAKALIVELAASGDPVALALQMTKELGAKITLAAATELADAVDGEPANIRLELEKLSLYATGREIDEADVDALVVSAKRYSIWKLADAFAAGNRRASMLFLDSLLREGEQPAGIVGVLAWMYRKLVEARELPGGINAYSAARELGMRPEAAGIALKQSRKISRERLLAGIAILAEADSALKSGAPNPRATLEFVLAQLTSPDAGAAA